MNLSKLQEIVKDKGAWCAAVQGVTESKVTQQLNHNNSGDMLKGHKSQLNITILTRKYNQKYKINIHKYTLI